jgi:molybdopterin synthase catalytic subunit
VAEPLVRAIVVREPLDLSGLLSRFSARVRGEAGAVVTFSGLARGRSKEGAELTELLLESHTVLTQRSLDDIAAAAAKRFPVVAIDVLHRQGSIKAGEAIVWVAVAAAHRRASFDAADYLMDRLKTEAVFWKKEIGPNGSAWIEPTEDDHAARAGWD